MKKIAAAFVLFLPLAACGGGGPSESDMRQAVWAQMQRAILGADNPYELENFEKHECHAMDGGRWRCSFEAQLTNQDPFAESGVFEDRGGTWVLLNRFYFDLRRLRPLDG